MSVRNEVIPRCHLRLRHDCDASSFDVGCSGENTSFSNKSRYAPLCPSKSSKLNVRGWYISAYITPKP